MDEKIKKIKLLALDFDGTLTDGYVYFAQDGQETVKCSRKDTLGIDMLKKIGIETVVISKETNPIVEARCRKMGVACWQGVDDGEGKLDILKRVASEKGVGLDSVAYMGDDLNDLAPLQQAGFSITVADGHPKIRAVCDFVTSARGGKHAVREACEKILTAKGINLEF